MRGAAEAISLAKAVRRCQATACRFCCGALHRREINFELIINEVSGYDKEQHTLREQAAQRSSGKIARALEWRISDTGSFGCLLASGHSRLNCGVNHQIRHASDGLLGEGPFRQAALIRSILPIFVANSLETLYTLWAIVKTQQEEVALVVSTF
uniref:Uncharacterized protein n=1 Tax=Trichuris muris TaxID=70415 RepID=A0A5S6QGK3_TRIMR